MSGRSLGSQRFWELRSPPFTARDVAQAVNETLAAQESGEDGISDLLNDDGVVEGWEDLERLRKCQNPCISRLNSLHCFLLEYLSAMIKCVHRSA